MQIIAWIVIGLIAAVMISGARSGGNYNRQRDEEEQEDVDDGRKG